MVMLSHEPCTYEELEKAVKARAEQFWLRPPGDKCQLSRVRDKTGKTDRSPGFLDPKKPKSRVNVARLTTSASNLCLDWLSAPPDGSDLEAHPAYAEHESVESTKIHDDADEKAPSLAGAFKMFQLEERLEPSEAWYCSKCKKHQEATKQLSLWRSSKILVLHLKRFSFRNILWKDKLDFHVEFPLEGLDASQYLPKGAVPEGEPLVYDLFAVSNHHGQIWGGHYTAYAKSEETGQWWLFDDSRTRKVTEKQVLTEKDAYILFYRRRD